MVCEPSHRYGGAKTEWRNASEPRHAPLRVCADMLRFPSAAWEVAGEIPFSEEAFGNTDLRTGIVLVVCESIGSEPGNKDKEQIVTDD